jgi:hypothetical protein
VKIVVLVAITLLIQRMFGVPGAPAWLACLQLTTVWVVAPAMRRHDPRWVFAAIPLGLAWDVALDQPVIGPGGVAWSAAALVVVSLAGVIADRTPKAWFASGAIAAVTAATVVELARWPLGLASPPTAQFLITSAVLSAAWCGLVGWILTVDFSARWRRYQSRRLR